MREKEGCVDHQNTKSITRLIAAYRDGEEGAFDKAVALLYDELRGLAHLQLLKLGGNPTLQTTAIVNEAYLKLKGSPGAPVDRSHFLAIAAKAMRHVVIDYAKSKQAVKRGGNVRHVSFEENSATIASQAYELVLIDAALERLAAHNPRLVRIFECKFFAGLEDTEAAQALGISLRTAQRDWMKARAFLSEYLTHVD